MPVFFIVVVIYSYKCMKVKKLSLNSGSSCLEFYCAKSHLNYFGYKDAKS